MAAAAGRKVGGVSYRVSASSGRPSAQNHVLHFPGRRFWPVTATCPIIRLIRS